MWGSEITQTQKPMIDCLVTSDGLKPGTLLAARMASAFVINCFALPTSLVRSSVFAVAFMPFYNAIAVPLFSI